MNTKCLFFPHTNGMHCIKLNFKKSQLFKTVYVLNVMSFLSIKLLCNYVLSVEQLACTSVPHSLVFIPLEKKWR